jgi:hypothetical protein
MGRFQRHFDSYFLLLSVDAYRRRYHLLPPFQPLLLRELAVSDQIVYPHSPQVIKDPILESTWVVVPENGFYFVLGIVLDNHFVELLPCDLRNIIGGFLQLSVAVGCDSLDLAVNSFQALFAHGFICLFEAFRLRLLVWLYICHWCRLSAFNPISISRE